jgi:TP901 family phage tail tape measure protein
MADANANIRIDVDTSAALANIKNLQRQISMFHSQMAQGGAKAAAASAEMSQSLVNGINATKNFSAQLTTINSSSQAFTTALEKNKLSMGQYFRFAGASTKTFGKLFKTEFNTINKVARERVKDLQTQYIKLGRNASGSLNAIKVRPLTLDMQNFSTQTAMAAQRFQLFNQLVKQGTTNLLNWGKNTQWAGRQLMVGFTVPLTIFGTIAAKEFQKLEEQAIKFRRVYGDMFTTDADTEKALSKVRELAEEFTKYGIAVEKTVDLAAKVAQMGNVGEALEAQVVQATRLSVLGGMEQMDALDTTISLTNAFKIEIEDLAAQINFLNAAENQTILSIEDFNTAVPLAGSVVQQLGGDVQDLAVLLTAMREGGINASQAGNALKSSLARLIAPSRNAKEVLGGFGIDVMAVVDQNAGDLMGTINTLAYSLDALDPLSRARSIEALFGKFQFARMSTMFQNIVDGGSQANKVLGLTANSAEELAIIADRELAAVEDSAATKFSKAMESLKAGLAPIGEAFLKAVLPIVEFVSKIIKRFNEMGDGAKQFVVILGAIGGVVAPALLMVVGLVANGIANIAKFGQVVGRYFGLANGASRNLGEGVNYLNQEQIEQLAVASSLDQVHSTLTQTFTAQAEAIARLVLQYDKAIQKQREFSGYGGAAAAGAAGAAGRAAGRVAPKKYASGVLSVPGPKGAGDVVPAMLSPGEAVIPTKFAEKYRPLIQGIIADNIPGFEDGIVDVGGNQVKFARPSAARAVGRRIDDLQGRRGGEAYNTEFFMQALERLAGTAVRTGEAIDVTGRAFEDMTRTLAEERGILPPVRAHVTKNFEPEDPRAQEALKSIGWDILPDDFKENLTFVSNLTAEIGQSSNLLLRSGNLPVDKFQQEWEGRTQKLTASAAAGGLDVTDLENARALADIEAEVGKEVIKAAEEEARRRGVSIEEITLHDNDIADATMRVIAKYEELAGATGDAARALRVRADQVGEVRSSQGKERIEQGLADGTLVQRGQSVDYVQPGTGKVAKGVARMPDAGGSVYASRDVPKTPGGAYGAQPLVSQKVDRDSRVESQVVEDAVDDAETRNDTIKRIAKDPYELSTEGTRNSPHPNASQDGFDDQTAYNDGRDKANKANPLAPPPPPPTAPTPPKTVGGKIMDKFEDSAVGQAIGRKLAKASGNALTDSKGNVTYDPNEDLSTWAGQMTEESRQRELQIQQAREAYLMEEEASRKLGMAADEQIQSAQMQEKAAQESMNAASAIENAAQKEMQDTGRPPATDDPLAPRKRGGGRLAAGLFGAGSIAMGASMMGGPVGEIAGKVAAPLMAIGGLMPVLGKLPPKAQAVVIGLAAVAMIAKGVYDSFKNAAKNALDLSEALGRGKKVMDSFAEAGGNVTASQIMERRRDQGLDAFEVQPGKSTFGESFMQGDDGQALLENVKKGIEQFGRDSTINKVFMQLGEAVAQGALDLPQAASIAAELGAEMGDLSLGVEVRGKLMELVDPSGTDLTINPLELQAKISIIGQEEINKLIEDTSMGVAESFQEGMFGMEAEIKAKGFMAIISGSFWSNFWELFKAGMIMMQEQLESIPVIGEMFKYLPSLGNYFQELAEIERMAEIIGATNSQLQSISSELDLIEVEYGKKIQEAISNEDSQEYVDSLIDEKLALQEDALARREQAINNTLAERLRDTGSFDLSMRQSLDNMFDPDQIKDARRAFDQANRFIDDPNKVAEVQLLLTTGDLPLSTLQSIWEDWDSRPDYAAKRLEVVTSFGSGFAQEMDMVLDIIEDEVLQAQYVELFNPNNITESTQALDALTAAARVAANTMGGIEMQEAILGQFLGPNSEEARNKLNEDLAELELYGDKITAMDDLQANAEFITDVFGIEALLIAQTIWDDIAPEDRKDAFYSILTTLDLDETDAFRNWRNSQDGQGRDGMQVAGVSIVDDYSARGALASRFLQNKEVGRRSLLGDDEALESSGQKASSILDDIVKKLRDVRMNQIIMTNGWVESANKLEELFGQGKSIDIFSGLEQDMRRLGLGEDLIAMIAGMDPEEFEKKKDQLFTFDAAGEITGITNILSNLGKAMKAIAMGDFQNEQERTIRTIGDQVVAIRKLTAAGLSQAAAYEMVQNAALASAIAQEKNIDVIRQLVRVTQEAKEMSQAFAAAQAVANKNEEVANRKKAIAFMQRNIANLTDAQKEMILSDTNVQALIGTNIDPKALRQALANAEEEAKLELQIKKLTFEGQIEIFEDGFGKAMEAFSAKQRKIEIEFDIKKKPFLDAIEEAEKKIQDIRDRPGGIDDLEADLQRISWQEEEINKTYQKRIDALEQVQKINQDIAASKKSQLDIADALSQGDIAAAARAVQESRAAAAERAEANNRASLETQRDATVAKLVGNMGLNREQIEKRVLDLKKEIFDLEENTIEPAQYRVTLLEREAQSLIDNLQVLGKSREEWEAIRVNIDLAKVSTDKFTAAMQEALDIVDSIITYWDDFDPDPKDIVINEKRIVTTEMVDPSLDVKPRETGGSGGGGGGSDGSASSTGATGAALDSARAAAAARQAAAARSSPVNMLTPQQMRDKEGGVTTQSTNPMAWYPGENANQPSKQAQSWLRPMWPGGPTIGQGLSNVGGFLLDSLWPSDPQGTAAFDSAMASAAANPESATYQRNQERNQAGALAGGQSAPTVDIEANLILPEDWEQVFLTSATGLQEKIDALGEDAGQAALANTIFEHFAELGISVPMVLQAIPDVFKNMPEVAKAPILEDVQGYFNTLASDIPTLLQTIPDFFTRLPESSQEALLEKINSQFADLGIDALDDLGNIDTWFANLPEGSAQVATELLGDYVREMAEGAEGDLDGFITTWFDTFPAEVQDSIKNGVGGEIESMSVEGRSKIESNLTSAFQTIKDSPILAGIGQTLSKMFGGVGTTANTTAEGTADSFASSSADASQSVATIKTPYEDLEAYITGPFETNINDSFENIKTAGVSAGNAIRNAFSLAGNAFNSTFRTRFSSILDDLAKVTIEGRKININRAGFNLGGLVPGVGNTDTVPAMLTPGEFVIRKDSVNKYGTNILKALNAGKIELPKTKAPTFSVERAEPTSLKNSKDENSSSVYNSYSISVNVKSDSSPDQIARTVIDQIKRIDSQKLRGSRF